MPPACSEVHRRHRPAGELQVQQIDGGSGGVGTGNHLAGELLKKMAGIDMLHVPFRGVSQALTSLYAGDIDIMFSSTTETVPHAREGRVRVLGVGTPQRIPELPNSPAVGEIVHPVLIRRDEDVRRRAFLDLSREQIRGAKVEGGVNGRLFFEAGANFLHRIR